MSTPAQGSMPPSASNPRCLVEIKGGVCKMGRMEGGQLVCDGCADCHPYVLDIILGDDTEARLAKEQIIKKMRSEAAEKGLFLCMGSDPQYKNELWQQDMIVELERLGDLTKCKCPDEDQQFCERCYRVIVSVYRYVHGRLFFRDGSLLSPEDRKPIFKCVARDMETIRSRDSLRGFTPAYSENRQECCSRAVKKRNRFCGECFKKLDNTVSYERLRTLVTRFGTLISGQETFISKKKRKLVLLPEVRPSTLDWDTSDSE